MFKNNIFKFIIIIKKMSGPRKTVIPLMLLGDSQVGKTSLTLYLTKNKFDDSILTTLGKESYMHQINLHGYDLKMKIWDTAGQERFKSMSVNVIKTVEGLILVYSIANRQTFENLGTWLKQLDEVTDMSKKPIVIVGNKCDLEKERQVSFEEGENYAKNLGYPFYETSAKNGTKVNEAFNDIFELLYKKLEEEIKGNKSASKNKQISLDKNSKKDKKDKKFC